MKYFNEQLFLPLGKLVSWIESSMREMVERANYDSIYFCHICSSKVVALQWEDGFEFGNYALCLSVRESNSSSRNVYEYENIWSNGESDIVVFKYDNDDRIVSDEILFEEGMYTLLSFIIDRL